MNKYLQLHRASAGSGKTYQLAKEFLWLYLTTKEDDGVRHLRTPKDFADAFPRILAITFTNKATNEMKRRIVDRLFDMSTYSGLPDEDVDYLEEFSDRLGVEPRLIRTRAVDALQALLFGYSGFNVSTIDSFFQTVLRAFAYETNLRSTYQVEIESEFVNNAAVDATLSEVNRKDAPEDIRYWIQGIIRNSAGKVKDWNLFQKNPGTRHPTPYGKLLSMANASDNEKYQEIATSLKSYFDNPEIDYRKSYEAVDNFIEECRKGTIRELMQAGREWIAATGGEESTRHNANFISAWKKIFNSGIDFDFNPAMKNYTSAFNTAYKGKTTDAEREIDGSFRERCVQLHKRCLNPIFMLWPQMRSDMMNLGLSSTIERNARQWLDDNNLVRLSQTNMILKRIINGDDAPFIYEKIGTRLHHYLIDEFQDTSDLQWDNLRPLVSESLSTDNENLIIGDAKQSIYRFRNANMNLIADTVPNRDFPGCRVKGLELKENTNYRSTPGIINFNNTLFSILPGRLESESHPTPSVEDIYTGAAQQIPEKTQRERSGRGYVEFNFFDWKNPEPDEGDDAYPEFLIELGDQIHEIMSRGYKMSDVAVLVRTNKEGRQVISALMDYNSLNPEKKIEVISDESLLISSSRAVGSVVEVLRMMIQPAKEKVGGSTQSTYLNANDIATNFNFFMIEKRRNGEDELSRAEHLAKFLDNPEELTTLDSVLHNLQAMTLSAIVEAVIGTFLSEEERRRDFPFLAAFQDAVMEFSGAKGSDIPSFLEWWDSKKGSLSISSPSGADAVTVMTIHKSKGLEFPIVIIPMLKYDPNRAIANTVWVPSEEFLSLVGEGDESSTLPPLPPYIPLNLGHNGVEDTPWEALQRQAQYEQCTDFLNTLYVGFTRTIDELYVNVKEMKKEPNKAAWEDFYKIVSSEIPGMVEQEYPEDEKDTETPGAVPKENLHTFVYGEKHQKYVPKTNDHKTSEEKMTPWSLEEYEVNLNHPKVARDESALNQGEREDPRSRGTRLHEIMSMVNTIDDLPNAIRRYRILGKISARERVEFEEYLRNALEDVQIKEFYYGKYRVVNEREMLTRGLDLKSTKRSGILRPDRIMVERDNPDHIVVLDYKFGNREKASLYRQQISDYINALRTAHPEKEISGLIWYVELGIKETV